MSKRKPNGFVIYDGPSLIDGQPIVVIAIRTKAGHANAKTGPMLQTYILRRDINPLIANKTGQDYSICGNCPSRGTPTKKRKRKLAENRRCYVQMGQGPLNVWRTFKRGRYPAVHGHAAIAAIGADQDVRLGTYGDPAAAPAYVWESLISGARLHTAYSHQSGIASAAFAPSMFMMSADSLQDARDAWSRGWRTFRVVRDVQDIVRGAEILCPASKEAGRRTTCGACGLCGGTSVKAKSVAIPAHGSSKGLFQ